MGAFPEVTEALDEDSLVDPEQPEDQHKMTCRIVLKTILNKGSSEMDKISNAPVEKPSASGSTADGQADVDFGDIPDNRLADFISTKCEPLLVQKDEVKHG